LVVKEESVSLWLMERGQPQIPRRRGLVPRAGCSRIRGGGGADTCEEVWEGWVR